MYEQFETAAETIHDAEFMSAFHVTADGSARRVLHSPESGYLEWLGHDEDGDDQFESRGDGFTPVHGLSGQHAYSGPIMHEAELFGWGVLGRVMANLATDKGLIVALVPVVDYAECEMGDGSGGDDEAREGYGELFGWSVMVRPVFDGEIYV